MQLSTAYINEETKIGLSKKNVTLTHPWNQIKEYLMAAVGLQEENKAKLV